MITIATLFWQANRHSRDFSCAYTETWVERLYRGFARNLTQPFRLVCFVDRPYDFAEPVETVPILAKEPDYSCCIEPFRLGVPMILVGLDTVIVGNIDHLAASCMTRTDLGLPRDPYRPQQACNGVVLCPEGMEAIALTHRGQNDMEWLRGFPHAFLDDEFPGEVVSYKGHVTKRGLDGARIVYLHGEQKMHQFAPGHPLMAHWR